MSFSVSSTKTNESVKDHNQTVYQQLKKGDLIEFHRGVYSHWAVYIGQGLLIHLAGEDSDGINDIRPQHVFTISGKTFNKAKVCMDEFWNVVLDCRAYVNNNKDSKWTPLKPEQIVEQALSKLGRVGYSLVTQNCEHFAKWCRYGVEKSDQVDNVLTGAAVGIASAAVAGLVYSIAKYWGVTPQTEDNEDDDED